MTKIKEFPKKNFYSSFFIIWAPLWSYMCSNWTIYSSWDLFDKYSFSFSRYGNGPLCIFIVTIYLLTVFGMAPKMDAFIGRRIQEKMIPALYSAIISLVVLLSSTIIQKDFDVILKLAVIWSICLIRYIFIAYKKENVL